MASNDLAPDLGARLRAGDEDVLADILHAHGPPITALLKVRLSWQLTTVDLEDVLATALFRLWQHRERFDASKASLRVWFFRIAENIARDVFKHGWHKARQLERIVEPDTLADIVDSRPPVVASEPEPVLSLPIQQLRELIALLPDAQRQIVLADAASRDGVVPSQQLSQELGIPASTVRVYRRRALERLRKALVAGSASGSGSEPTADSLDAATLS